MAFYSLEMSLQRLNSLEDFLEEHVAPRAETIGSDPKQMIEVLTKLVREYRTELKPSIDDPILFSNEELELLFSYSTTLAFTFWQHCGGVDMLSREVEWIESHPQIWEKVATWERLVGFGTTQLAKPVDPVIRGVVTEGGYRVSGAVPWYSGFGLIDDMVLGFDAGEDNVFALLPFFKTDPKRADLTLEPYQLLAMNGTSSVYVTFKDYFVSSEFVFSKVGKALARNRPITQYIFPELGVAKGAVRECSRIVSAKPHNARLQIVKENLEYLIRRISEIENDRKLPDAVSNTDLVMKKEHVIRDAVRLLTLTAGSGGLRFGSLAFRYHTDLLLWDAVVQSPFVMKRKISMLARAE